MKTSAKLLRYLLNLVGGLLSFAALAGFLIVGNLSVDTPVKIGLFVLLFGVLAGFGILIRRLMPHDPDDAVWPQFARDRITEDTSKPWWMVGLTAIGGLCRFAGYLGFMIFVILVLMTSGWGLRSVLMFMGPIVGLIALGYGIRWLGKRRCRLCRRRMVYRVSKKPMDCSTHWIVCFPCKIRAVAPASEDFGDDGGDGGDGD